MSACVVSQASLLGLRGRSSRSVSPGNVLEKAGKPSCGTPSKVPLTDTSPKVLSGYSGLVLGDSLHPMSIPYSQSEFSHRALERNEAEGAGEV